MVIHKVRDEGPDAMGFRNIAFSEEGATFAAQDENGVSRSWNAKTGAAMP